MLPRTQNNKFPGCPALMSDGRAFTDYRQNVYVNNLIRMSHGIIGSYEYRQFLINNSENLMESNRQYIENMNRCGPCTFKPVPFHEACDVTLENVSCKVVNPNGIGRYYKP